MNKVKIIATVGPATADKNILRQLIINGVDAFKINMSYSTPTFCRGIIKIINELNIELKTYVATILDIKGPTIKIQHILNEKAYLKQGDKIRIYKEDTLGDCTKFSVNYKNLISDVPLNAKIIIDGFVELKVIEKNEDYLICDVLKDGYIIENKTLIVPNVRINNFYLTEEDKEIIKFASQNNVDFLSLPFVTGFEDVLEVNDLLINIGNDHIQVISKIETNFAVDDIDEIIKVSDGIIIDRKNLGIEVPLEKIPGIQKRILAKCHSQGIINIVASDLLFNINDYPTRAEVSDVANAVLDGADCILLSDETAIGKNPLETLKLLENIVKTVEMDIDYEYMLEKSIKTEKRDTTGSLAYSVAGCALRLNCKAIFTPTMSGYTAKKISRFRPICPIVAPSPNEATVKSLALNFGVYPILIDDLKSLDSIIEKSKKMAKDVLLLKENDSIVVTGGFPFKTIKHTNFMTIEKI